MKKENFFKYLKKSIYFLSVFVFFSFLAAIFAAGILLPDNEISEKENRTLSQRPNISVASILNGSFMENVEAYLSDQFIFRDEIVAVNNFIDRLTGKTEFNGVYVGKNSRLFEVPSEFNAERVQKTVSAINDFALASVIPYKSFILVPNSTEILASELPSYLVTESQKSQIDTIYSMLSADIAKTDVVGIFNNFSDKSSLFYKTDHHWTSSAAYEIFLAFALQNGFDTGGINYNTSVASENFFGTLSASSGIYEKADEIEIIFPENVTGNFYVQNFDTMNKTASVFDVSALESSNQYNLFFGGNYSRIQILTKNLNERKLLVIKDSFANCFIPLLIPYYEKIVVIDPRYFTDNIYDIISDNGFTDLLFLYNVNTFLEDTVLYDMVY